MSYSRQGSLPLTLAQGSASFIPNNLTVHNDSLAYIRNSDVIIVSASGGATKVSGNRSVVQHIAFINVKGTTYLAISSSAGFQLWTPNGDIMVHFFSLTSVYPGADNANMYINSVSSSAGFVYAGCSSGEVLVMQLPTAPGGEVEIKHTLSSRRDASIWATSASSKYLLAGDEFGTISCFTVLEAFEMLWSVPLPSTDPVLSLAVRDETVLAGFASGHIRVYRANLGELSVEIAAHVRPVLGISIHPRECIFSSCSEDQFVSTWAMPDFESRATSSAESLSSIKLENRILTGIAHLPNDRLAVAAYDESDILIFKKE